MLRSVELVTDQGQVGVLDAGDVYTLTFQNPTGPDAQVSARCSKDIVLD